MSLTLSSCGSIECRLLAWVVNNVFFFFSFHNKNYILAIFSTSGVDLMPLTY